MKVERDQQKATSDMEKDQKIPLVSNEMPTFLYNANEILKCNPLYQTSIKVEKDQQIPDNASRITVSFPQNMEADFFSILHSVLFISNGVF